METNLVAEALKFMVLGMSVVGMFLLVMIGLIKVQAKLIAKFFSEKKTVEQPKSTVVNVQNSDKSKIVAAITGALLHHNSYKS